MSKRINKLSGDAKRDLLWTSIRTDQASDLRAALSATGVEAHTRHDETERTLIMEAAYAGKKKALETLLDWYERRRELRTKGWIDLSTVDEFASTSLMLAASGGHAECVHSLLRYGANPQMKDSTGKTALQIAQDKKRANVVEVINDFLKVDDEDDDGDGSGDDDPELAHLTTSQRRKLKKQNLIANERGAMAAATSAQEIAVHESESLDKKKDRIKIPAPTWAEVSRLCESFDQLRPVHELSVDLAHSSSFDPALWNCHWLNKLTAKMGGLVSLPGPELAKLSDLQQIVLSNCPKLVSLPEEIGSLKRLRVLECDGCPMLESLPASLSLLPNLTTLNANNCKLKSLTPALDGCTGLAILSVSGNALTELTLNFAGLSRLTVLKVSRNKLKVIPTEIGLLTSLNEFEAEGNQIKVVPNELSQLKKIKVLRLAGNPIVDGKVAKYLLQEGRGLKDLLKYLDNSVGKKAGGKGGGDSHAKGKELGEGGGAAAAATTEEQETSDLDIDEDEL